MDAENAIIKDRINKLKELRSWGVDPYPHNYEPKHKAQEITDNFSKFKDKNVVVAGRIMTKRDMGKAGFATIVDGTGRIQIYGKKDIMKDNYKIFKKLDLGDIIGVEGVVFKTKTGEITVEMKKVVLLTKSIRPLPEKFHGLKDPELIYRQRYVDLIVNKGKKEIFTMRSKILSLVREFLSTREFMEVETPILQAIYGGAEARPFKTHHNSLNMPLFLRVSPELFLKRLIVGGYDRIFEICKNFRNEGMDHTHNPEFTLVELYQTYADYNDMMKLTEELYEFIAKKLFKTTKITYQGKTIDVKGPWERMTMVDAIKKYTNIGNISDLSDDEIKDIMRNYNIPYEGDWSKGLAISLIFEELVEDKLIQPTFIIDHPKETTPLCKLHRKNSEAVERVEPYINGWEIGNGYSELNDPILQRKLLEGQAKKLRAGAEEAHPMDEDFVRAIEHGLPPTGGMGLGIDRMVMLFTDQVSIRDVIFFPTMRSEN